MIYSSIHQSSDNLSRTRSWGTNHRKNSEEGLSIAGRNHSTRGNSEIPTGLQSVATYVSALATDVKKLLGLPSRNISNVVLLKEADADDSITPVHPEKWVKL